MTHNPTFEKPESLKETQHGGTHYKDLVIEPAEYCHRNKIVFCAAEAIKYLTRYPFKNGAVDVKKALHFCQMILDFDYGIQTKVEFSEDSTVDLTDGHLILSWSHLAVPFDTKINMSDLEEVKNLHTVHGAPEDVDAILHREVSELIITSFYNCAPKVLANLLNQVFGLEGEHQITNKEVMNKERRRAVKFYGLCEPPEPEEDQFVPQTHIDLVCGDKRARFKTRFNVNPDALDLSSDKTATFEMFRIQYENLLKQAPEVITQLLNAKLGTDYKIPVNPYVLERSLSSQAAAMQRAAEPEPPKDQSRHPNEPLMESGADYRRNLMPCPPGETPEEGVEGLMTSPGLRRYSGFIWITSRQRIIPGSVNIKVPYLRKAKLDPEVEFEEQFMEIHDDGKGNLVGDVGEQSGLTLSTVDYRTGQIELTLPRAPEPDSLFDIRVKTERVEDDDKRDRSTS